MPVEIKIIGADAAESIKELSALAVCFAQKAEPKRQRKAEAVKETAPKPEPEVAEDVEPEVAKEIVPEPEVNVEPEENVPSIGELRALANGLGKGKVPAIRALLDEFGGESMTIPKLPEEKRQEFLARLQAL